MAEERSGRQGMLGRVLVTGATGFVGHPLVAHLAARGWAVTAGVRSLPPPARRLAGVAYAAVGEVGPVTEWGAALRGVTHVVHTAARVHAAGRRDEAEFDRVNARGTALLAEQAAECGVKRFVFLSSIKVNGEATSGQPFRAEDAPKPADAYARSKLAAEQALWRVCGARPMEGVVIRLPLVYGPGAKANVARLERLVESGLPLPFRSIDNRRSLLALGNLCDFVALALEHPQAAGRVWLLSDGADLSTAEIVQHIASARHRPARLVRCPAAFLRVLGRLTGRSAEVARLTGSLQLDSGPAHRELGWRPPFSMGAALAMATAYEAGATAGASTAMGDG